MHLKQITLHPDRYPTTEHYPFNLDLLRTTKSLRFDCPVTFFIGENGSGKSTLLDAITRKCGIMMWQGMQRPRYKASPYEKSFTAPSMSSGMTSGYRALFSALTFSRILPSSGMNG